MNLLLAALGVLAGGGLASVLLARWDPWANRIGSAAAVAGSLLGLVPALGVLAGGDSLALDRPWSVPYGRLALVVDPLSAFFLVAIFAVGALTAIHAAAFLPGSLARGRLGSTWLFYDLLLAGMAVVVTAANAVLFLVAWEAMALASYFLIATEHERADVRSAGWTYLVATHLGTAFLLALFVLLGKAAGSMDFADWGAARPAAAGALFLLAVVGFGAKAGLAPLHVWLPDAYVAAPGPIPAVLSGVMSKTAIYGLVRVLPWLGPPAGWWGGLLLAVGVLSGLAGAAYALASRDIKRALAYSSIENLGIVAVGLGLSLLGHATGRPYLAVVGLAGALLHVWNHAAFKSLLFLGSASIERAVGTRDLDEMGGLLKRMPATGLTFLAGSAAIAAVPPANGFASEFLLYLAAFRGVAANGGPLVSRVAAIVGLGLVGGLALALFAKLAGIALLGEPRRERTAAAADGPLALRAPLVVLGLACFGLGLAAPWLLDGLGGAISLASGLDPDLVRRELDEAVPALARATAVSGLFLGTVAVLAAVRWRLLAGKEVGSGPTWDCGYALPNARMQYTGSSFSQPLTTLFAPLIGHRERCEEPAGFFPARGSFETEAPDVVRDLAYGAAFRLVLRGAARLRWLQHGSTHLYILYVVLAVLSLLVWLVS